MKSQKGITLTSLGIYIVLVILVVGILAVITSTLQGNIKEIYKEGTNNSEIDKFNMYFLREVNTQGNAIDDTTSSSITRVLFTSGNKYTFNTADKCIYLNDNIKIAENIERCLFNSSTVDDKTVISVRIKAVNGEEKTIEYTLDNVNSDSSYEDESSYMNNQFLPSEYQQVEYIESTGAQWINTGIYPKSTTVIDLTMQLKVTNADLKFLGTYNSQTGICLGTISSKWRIGGGEWTTTWSINTTADKVNIRAYENTWVINEQTATSSTAISENNEAPIALFGVYYKGTMTQKSSIRVYNLKIFDGNVIQLNLIPCYRRTDNVVGMYDLVSNKFLVNQEAGEDFIIGPEIK